MKDLTLPVINDIKFLAERLSWWESNKASYSDVIEKLEDLGYEASLTCTGIDIRGAGDKKMLEFAFRILRTDGWEPSSRPEDNTTYFSTFFGKDGLKNIWFSFSSTVCRRVQVGTELKEIPVYEVRCDG